MKAYLTNGEACYFLVHVEIQDYPDPNFPTRMFEYGYRLRDKHQCPITALVLYTGTNRKYHVNAFNTAFFGTVFSYQFNTFVLLDHPLEVLNRNDNIFARVLEAAWQGLMHGKWTDEELFRAKIRLIKNLLNRKYTKPKIRRLIQFISFYATFQNKENWSIFENKLSAITKSRKPMGIIEAIRKELKDRAWNEGLMEGKREGIKVGIKEGKKEGIEEGDFQRLLTIVKNAYEEGFSIEDISRITKLSSQEVEKLLKDAALI